MRYGSASIVCAFSLGIGWVLAEWVRWQHDSTPAPYQRIDRRSGRLTGGNSTGTGIISTGTIGSGTGSTGSMTPVGSERRLRGPSLGHRGHTVRHLHHARQSGSDELPCFRRRLQRQELPSRRRRAGTRSPTPLNTFVNAPGARASGGRPRILLHSGPPMRRPCPTERFAHPC